MQQNIPNPTEPRALGAFCNAGVPAVFLWLAPSSPWHACIPPHSRGREGIWLEVSWGSTWRSNQMAFYGCSSPAQNIKVGFAHWSLQKGRMKTQVHICTFMSCRRCRPFIKKKKKSKTKKPQKNPPNPTFAQLNSGRATGRGSLANPKD